jgi:hypothetical protein
MMPASHSLSERGNAVIEFALSFGFIFAVLTGIFQFGYAFWVYNNLESAAMAGARYASLRTYDSTGSTPSNAFQSAVQNMVVYGNPNGGSQPVVPKLSASHVKLEVILDRGVPRKITVSITGYQIDAVFKSFTLTGKPKVAFPYVGRYAPV